jgi:hypothetical protein
MRNRRTLAREFQATRRIKFCCPFNYPPQDVTKPKKGVTKISQHGPEKLSKQK